MACDQWHVIKGVAGRGKQKRTRFISIPGGRGNSPPALRVGLQVAAGGIACTATGYSAPRRQRTSAEPGLHLQVAAQELLEKQVGLLRNMIFRNLFVCLACIARHSKPGLFAAQVLSMHVGDAALGVDGSVVTSFTKRMK